MHDAAIVRFIAELLLILLSAKLFGEISERLGQPAVLGELIGGVVLGTGLMSAFHVDDPALALMSELGVVLLLFETGLQCGLDRLLDAGPTALAVAATGVVAPFALGWGVMSAFGRGGSEALFVGAALTATSVGITARVLSDMGRLSSHEAQIALGAAVVDDVIGLVILAAVQGVVFTGAVRWLPAAKVAGLSAAFLIGAFWLGPRVAGAMVGLVRKTRARGVLVGAAVSFAFALALAAHAVGTALIVGAFCAGVLLAGTEKKEDVTRDIRPVVDVFAPVFFVMVGAKVDLSVFNPVPAENRTTLLLIAALILAAVAGKLASALPVRGKGLNRWSVGFAMIPRGEVGLIFAQIGLAAGAIDAPLYAAVVATVVATTFLAPPLLKRSLA
jgi:Kef-type K+ transport system membrane component KefB